MDGSDTYTFMFLSIDTGKGANVYKRADEAKFTSTVPAFVRPPRIPPS
jgi:hypothetical protein